MAILTVPNLEKIAIDPKYKSAKRVLDLMITLLLIVPLCLVCMMVAVMIRLDSKGTIFYRQKRVGLGGKEFYMYKFRSMVEHCDDSVHRAAITKFMSGEKLDTYKKADDPRITRVGRFIRKTSLDELPQFLNVVRGEMSLVGPRPPLPYEVEQYRPQDWLRLSGKPGLTGGWQVYGRSQVPFEEMVQMDIAYLRRQSIWEDLKLILLTIPVMIQGRGGA
ncbi:MAG: sugar transferase [Chloroflexi bacterium]|nr:sugar transferase [Chloroflexota bacterium]